MTTRVLLTPQSADLPSSNMPEIAFVSASVTRFALLFDATTNETAFWTFIAPQGLTLPLTAVITYYMVSATSGNIALQASLEAITDGDVLNITTTDSFDTANSLSGVTVPGSAGNIDQQSITLTNADSIVAGDLVRFRLVRDAATDTAVGDMGVVAVEIRDAA